MKQFLSLWMAALLCIGTASACKKKSLPPLAERNQPLTVIVMDTTQALLANAQVKVQKQVYKTSFDGRVVLQPAQVTSSTFLVSCEGYKSAHAILKDEPVLIVQLLPDPKARSKSNDKVTAGPMYLTGAHREVLYAKTAMPMAEADVLSVEEEAPRILPDYGGNSNVSAGRLTAGEVNDFTKWYFWSKVLDGSHQQYIAEWKLTPRHRYTVQVMTKSGHPVTNYPVNLTDNRGNTVFQAVTDNTGKAELWNGLAGSPSEVNQPEWKTIVVDEPCEANDEVDVMFVFDATGSMGDELRYLQAEMNDVISRAKEATGGLTIRTGAVVYRDHQDEYLTRISRLTEDIKTTQTFIDKQQANGGGDYPEAVPEALMAAMNSAGWNPSARARVAFLILDAPCHRDSATIALLHEQILNAAALGVRIVPVVCSGIGESGELLVRSIALATNGTSFFLTDDSGIGNPHLKPTTDSLKVEHLNDMMVRTIVEFSTMPYCEGLSETGTDGIEEAFLPNPFDEQDLAADPSIPHGEGVHYLLDVSGKLLGIFEGEVKTDMLPIGVYFIKTYYDGQWFTEKVLKH